MTRFGVILLLHLGPVLASQETPSVLAISREDAGRALEETGRNLVTEGAKGLVKAQEKRLQDLASMSNTRGKQVLGVEGAGKRAQVAVLKGEAAQKTSWLRRWRLVSGVLEVGDAIGAAGGYLVEGDARGAFGVMADKAGQKLSGWAGGAAGTLVAGPLGAVAGSAAGEGSWEALPVKKWIQRTVDEGRDREAADRLLGYRPAWRDHEASEARKRREAAKAGQEPAAAAGVEEAAALRKQVEGRLISQNLPAPEDLVNQLVGLVQSRGMDALEAALRECSAMQGDSHGSLDGRGALKLSISGLTATATFEDRNEASAGGVRAVATTTGTFKGTFDPVSGNVVLAGTLKVVAVARGIQPTPDLMGVKFTGHFTGDGFKGNAVCNGRSLPWTTVR